MTHVAVTEAGIQRVSYETLRDSGLDLLGVRSRDIALTWRGEPVARWIDGKGTFGPGSSIEFIGRAPRGDDALYVESNLYQVSIDPVRARPADKMAKGKARKVSDAYLRESTVDRAAMYHPQSPTGDPWVEHTVLVRGAATVTLTIPVDGPVLDGPSRLLVGLGTVTDLPDLTGPGGEAIPEHNVEVWFSGPGSDFVHVTTASTSGQQDWELEAEIPRGVLQAGTNRLQLRFDTDYFYSLVVIDRYGVRYPSPYLGPELDFDSDPSAGGYRVHGFGGPSIAAYGEHDDGSLTRITPWVTPSAGGFAAELRQLDAAHFWLDESPYTPEVFTTDAPADLLAGSGELVVIADSSFVGTQALDDYLAEKSAFDPVVIDVEDIYNGVGFGMALPGAITDYLKVRSSVRPFTHVQLVGTDCYDRLNYVSDCLSFIPLPSAPVGVSIYSPSQNRLVDLDGDGVGDKAVAQFSVRDEAELATIVQKGADWNASGLSGEESALLIAEETDGIHSFRAQIERLKNRAPAPPAVADQVLALGERLAAPLLALALREAGLCASPQDAAALIRTDATFGAARVDVAETYRQAKAWHTGLPASTIPVVTGFIGATATATTTTLGRGGSDYSAALLAAALRASVLERWTDVDGLYTDDPYQNGQAQRLTRICLEEAWVWNHAGRLGMHCNALDPLVEAEIPIHVRSIAAPEGLGTWILPAGYEPLTAVAS